MYDEWHAAADLATRTSFLSGSSYWDENFVFARQR